MFLRGGYVLHRLGWLFCLHFCLFIILYAVFYYTHTYDYLADWYLSSSPDLYHPEIFFRDFFTPATKSTGDKWCIAAIILSLLVGGYAGRKFFKKPECHASLQQSPLTYSYGYLGSLLLIAVLFWYWGQSHLRYCPDEMFSVHKIAEHNTFHTLSFYFAPNNHIFFNLLNNVFFHSVNDKVFTGRIISLIAYLATTLIVFNWFRQVVGQKSIAFWATILVISQYSLWGWAVAARGYAIQNLCAWSLFVMMSKRNNKSFNINNLGVMMLCTFIGYATLPSFFMFHAAIMLIVLVRNISIRTVDRQFWFAQIFTIAIVLLFYIPVITISGLHSLAANKYVTNQVEGSKHIGIYDLYAMMRYFIDNYFIGQINGVARYFGYALFLLPTIAFFTPDLKREKYISIGFWVIWLTVLCVCYTRNILPPHRVIAAQFSISFAMSITVIYSLIKQFIRYEMLKIAIWVILCGVCAIYFISTYYPSLALLQYGV